MPSWISSAANLFFDEADALFGKRSEVQNSIDRYANIETSYLLQKMEQYEGIAILATNLRQNLDEAFTRRLQYLACEIEQLVSFHHIFNQEIEVSYEDTCSQPFNAGSVINPDCNATGDMDACAASQGTRRATRESDRFDLVRS